MSTSARDSTKFDSKEDHDASLPPPSDAVPGCTYNGQTYAVGAEECMSGSVYKCGEKGWFNTKKKC
jgi:hypothetical protein